MIIGGLARVLLVVVLHVAVEVHELGPAQNLLEAVDNEATLFLDTIGLLAGSLACASVTVGALASASCFFVIAHDLLARSRGSISPHNGTGK